MHPFIGLPFPACLALTSYSAAPNMNISFLGLGSVSFSVGPCSPLLPSGVDDYFFLPFLLALETELFFIFNFF